MAQPDNYMDLRGTPCPLNFVRAKLRLQQMRSGEFLELWIDSGEPVEQVPDSLTMAGYAIEALFEQADYFVLRVRCPVSAS
ncbi:MAG: sulfurtransferase TusA family protein [Coleofasciculaceae cyanobacterium RL_1_1]|nr:sulfurtransferase TusA family protein [Coleofasciculaceae cyanobacterium RL_1_1]